ncbi:MAG TPA: hypothetical protein VJ735_05425, partial [Actinomycetes bacterium]|nr:hypothetical protein [Actinomycetes bacterium]
VAGAMAAADAGEIALMPPTYLTCLEVGRHQTAADVVAAATTEAPYQQLRPLADIRGGEDWKHRVITKLVRDTVADAVQARS